MDKSATRFAVRETNGGRGRDRTGDPLLAKQVLSQLSYTPTCNPMSLMDFLRERLPASPSACSRKLNYTSMRCNHHPSNSLHRLRQYVLTPVFVRCIPTRAFSIGTSKPKPILSRVFYRPQCRYLRTSSPQVGSQNIKFQANDPRKCRAGNNC